ncbi:MAG: hypothetical protein RL717_959 [Pseudomonadota bacterium]
MWSSETEKATEWDLFLPCRATCKVRIPRDSGEKKPTETGWFFNDWWRRRESNPRPEVLYRQFYILSAAI